MLVGPIIAPLIGGAITDAFNWRATFVLLAIITFPIAVFSYFIMIETHHYIVSRPFQVAYDQLTPAQSEENKLAENGNEEASFSSLEDPKPLEIEEFPIKIQQLSLKEIHSIKEPELVMPWSLLGLIFESQLTPYYIAAGITFAA